MGNREDWTEVFPPLKELPASDVARLRSGSAVVSLPTGSRIFGPGQKPEKFLLLLSGTIRVQQAAESGREIVLYRVAPGESCTLTTACMLGREDYLAEAIAETPVRAAAIPRSLFDELIASSRPFRQFVFTAFSQRVTNLFRLIGEVAFARIDLRLAQRLLQMADNRDHLSATHQELASELGSAREVISRQLQEFQRRGWIKVMRGEIQLTDRAALSLLAEA
jgi:CRP/FNR family transcriptional regulator